MVLPPHLAERVEPNAPSPRAGRSVIWWARIAARATENPALDVALTMAKVLGVPCFVYHALSERYRYASDRIHTFALEGARDLQRDLKARGIGAVFHLQRSSDRRPHLLELAKDAALVVSDFMPVQPFLTWDAAVAKVAPLWRVDASCLAPVWSFPRPHDRAFSFRKLAAPLWKARLTTPWRDVEPSHPAFVPEFDSLDLSTVDLPTLVASCDIDHSIGPVHHTRGGDAGLSRWTRYLETTLHRYEADRNDPLRQANSRISAYLHFGHLSPFRVARDCAAHRTDSSEKFLDELLTWRELAWHFCWHHPNHESVEVLPAWARQTLQHHERDGREFLPSFDQLATGQTGHSLWDAAQRSLLTHGELHNNVRMTWGKALIPWTRNAKEALALLVDLNHRYALDGRDPASYGGILWCLGGLDRPFTPETKFFGTVRARDLDEQARRFDVAEYERRMHEPSRGQPLAVAIIGAGVSGAACARALRDSGHTVTVFDKGRGPGGRVATRREGELSFDHGAQFFNVSDERFARCVRSWWHERIVAEWTPKLAELGSPKPRVEFEAGVDGKPPIRLVAKPGMSALLERMLEGIDVRSGTRVDAVVRRCERFGLTGEQGAPMGEYDAVVVAVPSPQAAILIDPLDFALASRIREATMRPTWAVMLAFSSPLSIDFDAARVNVGPLEWLARESSKPDRRAGERWVLHATADFSHAHVDATASEVLPELIEAFFVTTGAPRAEPVFARAHRWRYASVTKPLGEDCLVHSSGRLIACGDWCLGARIEAAFLSGSAAAGRLNAIPPSVVGKPTSPLTGRTPSQLRLV
jgi:photolyase PhrII